jgi:hypothetical protein
LPLPRIGLFVAATLSGFSSVLLFLLAGSTSSLRIFPSLT